MRARVKAHSLRYALLAVDLSEPCAKQFSAFNLVFVPFVRKFPDKHLYILLRQKNFKNVLFLPLLSKIGISEVIRSQRRRILNVQSQYFE